MTGDYFTVRVASDDANYDVLTTGTGSGGGVPSFEITRLDAGGGGGPAIGATVYDDGVQVISHGTSTAVNLDNEDFDTDGFHDTSTNNERFTIPAGLGGTYMISGYAVFEVNSTGQRALDFRKNGSTFIGNEINSPINSHIGSR